MAPIGNELQRVLAGSVADSKSDGNIDDAGTGQPWPRARVCMRQKERAVLKQLATGQSCDEPPQTQVHAVQRRGSHPAMCARTRARHVRRLHTARMGRTRMHVHLARGKCERAR